MPRVHRDEGRLSQSFDHVAVTVSDMDRSLRFYRDLLGLKEVERHLLKGDGIERMTAKHGVVMQVTRLSPGGEDSVLIDLQQYVSPKGRVSDARLGDTAHTHFALRVRDLDSAYTKLKAKGVRFVSEPVVFELDFGTVKVVFVEDPDGAIVELTETITAEKTRRKKQGKS